MGDERLTVVANHSRGIIGDSASYCPSLRRVTNGRSDSYSEMGGFPQRLSLKTIRYFTTQCVCLAADTPLRAGPKIITLSGASLSIPPIVCNPPSNTYTISVRRTNFLLFF